MIRRSFLASILAAGIAPAVARAGVLMPVKPLVWVPDEALIDLTRPIYLNITGHQAIRIPQGALKPGQKFTLNVKFGAAGSSLELHGATMPGPSKLPRWEHS